MKKLLLAIIRLYQLLLSPLLGKVCRFEPSCSRYAAACIESHGAARGGWLALKRLGRCHPFHPGGFDPPPRALADEFTRTGPDAVRTEPSCNTDCRAHGCSR